MAFVDVVLVSNMQSYTSALAFLCCARAVASSRFGSHYKLSSDRVG